MKIIRLHFTTPVHLGLGLGEEYDRLSPKLHSDTLKSALASAYVELYGEEKAWDFFRSFRVSSAFPFIENECFIPKPFMRLPLECPHLNENRLSKLIKKLEFLSADIFNRILAGETVRFEKKQLSPDGKILSTKELKCNAYQSYLRQRVTIREHAGRGKPEATEQQNRATPFYMDFMYFEKNAGLYFMLQEDEPNFSARIESCLLFLADQGLGTDRSVGSGLFSHSKENLELYAVENPDAVITLGLYCPLKEELQPGMLENSRWQLMERGGYMSGSVYSRFRHLRKKKVYMFTEGSMFYAPSLEGKIVDLRPEWNDPDMHPVWRDGRPVCVPLRINQN